MLNKRGQVRKLSLCNFLPENHRGQGLSVNVIILLVLGLAVLVLLILGFTIGWNKILPFISGNNIDTIVNQCQASCSTNSQFGFCATNKSVNDGINPKFDATCYQLATNTLYTSRLYGIELCPQVNCNVA